jgi:ribosome modulation factor
MDNVSWVYQNCKFAYMLIPHDQGKQAYHAGQPFESNPYANDPRRMQEAEQWQEGWNEAKAESVHDDLAPEVD